MSFWMRWYSHDEEIGSIRMLTQDSSIELIYRARSYGDEWQDMREVVPLAYTRPHFGGERTWFRCPSCGRRCAKLFGGWRFLCRKCHRLSYASQSENRSDRLLRKAQNIRMRLGGSPNMMMTFPEKPKGMHWRTYWRIRTKAEMLEAAMWGATAERFGIRI